MADAQDPAPDGIVVIGLGYVGLPLAIALSDHFDVTGYDIDPARIAALSDGRDRTGEIPAERLTQSQLRLTTDPEHCRARSVYIVTVPTPVDRLRRPDLSPLMAAIDTVRDLIAPGSKALVVIESTVFPGVTEDICGPALETGGRLKRGRDFVLGYSPERINPGDREHSIDRIVKVVSGEDAATLTRMADMYGRITSRGVFEAASIKAAEAAKVIENAQRDINIAFVNEITQIFSALDLTIWDVLAAARTKWNFLDFTPGLVGGHCIGVDPYYLAHVATEHDHDPRVILAGRAINDGMGAWIAEKLHDRRGGRAGSAVVLGLTFKENVPDIRNSKVIDLVRRLQRLGHDVTLHDPLIDAGEFATEYAMMPDPEAMTRCYDLVIPAVAHRFYRELDAPAIGAMVAPGGLLADLKAIWRDVDLPGVERWSL